MFILKTADLEQTCKELQTLIKYILQPTQKNGEGGIRTPGTLLRYTVFPGLHLKPLGHFSSVLYSSLSSNQNRSISNIWDLANSTKNFQNNVILSVSEVSKQKGFFGLKHSE